MLLEISDLLHFLNPLVNLILHLKWKKISKWLCTAKFYIWTRGWAKIIWTDILLHTSKTIAPRVKNQARGQNKWSRALKWGIVRLCSLNAFGDTTKFIKMWVFQFLHFCKKILISLYKDAKTAKTWKSDTFYLYHISSILWATETYYTSF